MRAASMGDLVRFQPSLRLVAQFPASCRIRLKRGGKTVTEQAGDRLEHPIDTPGVYRVEGWVELGGEERGWLYSNPIYAAPAPRRPVQCQLARVS